MDKSNEKRIKFSDAIKRLEEALKEYEEYQITSSRDGVIQRFEFCTELAWKSTREYLLAQGYG
ncbi:MAG: nucleotidyltransferase substrate binding protein [Acutalibacteraceae bacterium]